MNYFTHGRRFLDDPYFVVGTALPDWLRLVDRRMRVSRRAACPFADDDQPHVQSLARGIVQHHHDDHWFHGTRVFGELSLQFTVAIRDALPPDNSFRPSFLGHILVEMLLDDVLIRAAPQRLDRYYEVLESVSPGLVQSAVHRMATRPSPGVAELIPRFCQARFLYDYADDEKLLLRINAVLRRVKLAPLPAEFRRLLPAARHQVSRRRAELLQGESSPRDSFPRHGDPGDKR